MDGLAVLDPSVADEHEALLEFVYVCPHGLAEFGADGAVRMMNPACSRMLMPLTPPGGTLDNLLDALSPFVPDLRARLAAQPGERGLILDGLAIHIGRAQPQRIVQFGARARTGPAPPQVLALTVLRLADDRHMAVLADISEQVAQREQLRDAEAWFSALADGARGFAVFGLDAAGRLCDWNASAHRLFGLSAEQAIGLAGDALLSEAGSRLVSHRLPRIRSEGWQVLEGWMQGPQGDRFWGTAVISAMPEVSGDATYLVVVRDMTERREQTQALRRALCQDHLTGLLNRRHFFEVGEAECRAAARDGVALSVIMVDADHFKAVNDQFGHAAGDAVLRALAELLRNLTRQGIDMVGRLGGEEFAVLLPGHDTVAAMAVAERLRAAVAALHVATRGRDSSAITVRVTASFGVAACAGAQSLDGLLAQADAALYGAKAAGRDRVHSA